jgi:hypothetical protein
MKRTRYTHAGIVAALLVGFGVLSVYADEPEVVTAIRKQADSVSKKNWADLSKDGAAIAKKHELIDVMTLMKLRKPGAKTSGLGVGATPGATKPDGIEAQIISLSKNGPPAMMTPKQRGELIHTAELAAAIASTSYHQCTVDRKMGAMDPADWKKWSQDMYGASQELIKALQAKDAMKVKTAATTLNKACTDCHAVFR